MQQYSFIQEIQFIRTGYTNSNFYKKIMNLGKMIFFISIWITSIRVHCQTSDFSDKLVQKITLDEILNIASKNSLDVFKAKNQYEASYWQFRSYKSSLLPKVDFSIDPLTYNRSFVERYDSEQNIDVYRLQQNLNSYANISLSQNIKATGAKVFVNSSFNRIINFGDTDQLNYNVTPVQIGFIQPLMAFNEFKWQDKTEPIKYKKSKKEYIYNLLILKLKTVDLFFNWALTSNRVTIAKENYLSAKKLFKIGKRRYDIGSLERDDILNLELEVFNSKTNLTQVEKELKKAEVDLMVFLRKERWNNESPQLPHLITNLQIEIDKALVLAQENNPNLIDLKLKEVEGLRDLDQAIKDNRFDLSLSASYGLNQQSDNIQDAYSNFLDQQLVAINMKIPILDWGERRGNINTARTNKEVIDIEIEQEKIKIKQEISLKVIDFNLQEQLVQGTLRSSEISRESYEITQKRFLSGKIDLLKLTSAREVWQAASETYIQSLFNYWKFYYEVQQLTLYDFMNNKTLEENFDEIIGK